MDISHEKEITTWRTPRCETADRLRDRLYVMVAIYHPHHKANPHYIEAAELLDRHLHRSGCAKCEARRVEMMEWERQDEKKQSELPRQLA